MGDDGHGVRAVWRRVRTAFVASAVKGLVHYEKYEDRWYPMGNVVGKPMPPNPCIFVAMWSVQSVASRRLP